MRESDIQEEPSLAAVAFLYARGQLSDASAAAFEQRLGEEQAARDALCYAVLLTQTSEGQPAPMPSPAYREKVRQRLRPGFGRRFFSRHTYPGHPAFWTGLGMAAALLLMMVWPRTQPPAPVTPAPAAVASPLLPPASPDAAAETARRWADLHNNEHLTRARREEFHRRLRAEDHRLVLSGERQNPFLGHEPQE